MPLDPTRPLVQQFRFRTRSRASDDENDSEPIAKIAPWYIIFRMLSPVGRTSAGLQFEGNHYETLHRALSAVHARSRAIDMCSDNELFNVLAVVVQYLLDISRVENSSEWYFNATDRRRAIETDCWLLIRVSISEREAYDATRVETILHDFELIRRAAIDRIEGQGCFEPIDMSAREMRQLRHDSPEQHIVLGQQVEQRMLVALATIALSRARQLAAYLSPDDFPHADRSGTSATDQLANWCHRADKRWWRANTVALYEYFAHTESAESSETRLSFYFPFLYSYEYDLLWARASQMQALVLGIDPRRVSTFGAPQPEKSNSRSIAAYSCACLTYANRAVQSLLWMLGVRADLAELSKVQLSGNKAVDRQVFYRRAFSDNSPSSAYLNDAVRLELETLQMLWTYLEDAGLPNLRAIFASLALALRSALGQNKTSTSSTGSIHVPQTLMAIPHSAEYRIAKDFGLEVSDYWSRVFDRRSRPRSEPLPTAQLDPRRSLSENMLLLYPTDNFRQALANTTRLLRLPTESPPRVLAQVVKIAELLWRELVARRAPSNLMYLLRMLLLRAPTKVTTAKCADLAVAILDCYRVPAMMDLRARATWAASLREAASLIAKDTWQRYPNEMLLVVSALGNLALTAERDHQIAGKTVLSSLSVEQPTITHTLTGQLPAFTAALLRESRLQPDVTFIEEMLRSFSASVGNQPSALVMPWVTHDGSAVRTVVAYLDGSDQIAINLIESIFCRYKSGLTGTTVTGYWEALEDVQELASEEGAIFVEGKLVEALPWDGCGGNFVRISFDIVKALEVVRLMGKVIVPTPIVVVPAPEISHLPWQLLLCRYGSGVADRTPEITYLTCLQPHLAWWMSAIRSTETRRSENHEGVFVSTPTKPLYGTNGGTDYRALLMRTLNADKSKIGRALARVDVGKKTRIGASMHIDFRHGDAGADPSTSSLDHHDSDDQFHDKGDVEARISVILACYGGRGDTVHGNYLSDAMYSLRYSKACFASPTEIPVAAAIDFIGHIFAPIQTDDVDANCLDVYSSALYDKATQDFAMLMQYWGTNEPLLLRAN